MSTVADTNNQSTQQDITKKEQGFTVATECEAHPSPATPCPRCGEPVGDATMQSLSRADNDTWVCSPCGLEEALGQAWAKKYDATSSMYAPRGVLPSWVARHVLRESSAPRAEVEVLTDDARRE